MSGDGTTTGTQGSKARPVAPPAPAARGRAAGTDPTPAAAKDSVQPARGLGIVQADFQNDFFVEQGITAQNARDLNLEGLNPDQQVEFERRFQELNGGSLVLGFKSFLAALGFGIELKVPLVGSAQVMGLGKVLVNKAFSGGEHRYHPVNGASHGGLAKGMTFSLDGDAKTGTKRVDYFVMPNLEGQYEVMTRDYAEKRYPDTESRLNAFGSWLHPQD